MKYGLAIILSLLVPIFFAACGSSEEPIKTVAEAKAAAAEKGMKVLIQVSTLGCADCGKFNKSMEESTKVKEALKKVVFLDVDVTTTDGKQLADAHNIRTYPTYLLMNADGSIKNSWYGFFGAGEWAKALETFLAK